MLKSTFADWLNTHQACSDARAFVGNKTLTQAWAECNRPDWMLWLLEHLDYNDQQTLRLYACWCAANTPLADGRKTWDLLTDNRSRKAILVAIDYANGEAADQKLAAAGDAAWDAVDAVDAVDAARAAARAASGDASWAAAWAATWSAARVADWSAAAYWAAAAAGGAARAAATAAQANELRRRIPLSTVLKLARKAGIKE